MKSAFFVFLLCLPSFCLHAQQSVTAAAQQQAVAAYPDLSRDGSPLHDRFIAEYQRLKSASDPLLSRSDWPMVLARRCAEDLKVEPANPITVITATPKPTPTTKPPPKLGPSGLDSGGVTTGGLNEQPLGRKVSVKGTVLSVDDENNVVIIYAASNGSFGMANAEGAVAVTGTGLIDKLSDGDTADLVGRENGFYKYTSAMGAAKRVHQYKFESGHFRDSSGRNIK